MRHADNAEDDEVMRDPMIRELRRLMPGNALWQDPVAVKRLRDDVDAARFGESRATTPSQDAQLKQGREKGMQPLRGEKPVPAGESGQASGDNEFLDEPESWNQTKKL